MARYFQSLAQAEKHVYEKQSHPGYGKLQWCIIDCTTGYLVLSAAQAKHCFPASLFLDPGAYAPTLSKNRHSF